MKFNIFFRKQHKKFNPKVFSGKQKESTGLITKIRGSSKLQFRECNTTGGGTYSAEPYCAGRRECINRQKELNNQEIIIGEWHTHPDVGFSPPSASDMYQLLVACVIHQLHNCCVVFAKEGTYVMTVKRSRIKRIEREMRRFFLDNKQGLNTCREPIIDAAYRRSYPYLNQLLNETVRIWRQAKQIQGPFKRIVTYYSKWVDKHLHIRIQFLPANYHRQ